MAKRINLVEFEKRADSKSWAIVAGHVSLVLAPVFLAALIGPSLLWLVLWVLFGLLMSGLLNLMHECAHYHVFRERAGSDLIGRWLLGPLLLADFDGYRERHWKHHTHLGVDGDTKDSYLIDIRNIGLVRLFLECLSLQAAVQKFRKQVSVESSDVLPRAGWIKRTALVQAGLLGILVLLAGPISGRVLWPWGLLTAGLAYALVYVYGLASLTIYAATLRAIAEHQKEAGQKSTTGRAVLRNFKCGPVAWLVFGAYGFAEHATHHREPALAYYHLPRATAYLAATDKELVPRYRYITELLALAKGKYERG
jgi:fatty acid desaturase